MSQFKVGDWVVSSKRKEVFQIVDMFTDGYSAYVTSIKLEPRTRWDSGIYYGQYSIEDVYLWTPSIGEWCWFWDTNKDMTPILAKFAETSETNGLYFESSNGSGWDYCEPFIGTLPTGAK